MDFTRSSNFNQPMFPDQPFDPRRGFDSTRSSNFSQPTFPDQPFGPRRGSDSTRSNNFGHPRVVDQPFGPFGTPAQQQEILPSTRVGGHSTAPLVPRQALQNFPGLNKYQVAPYATVTCPQVPNKLADHTWSSPGAVLLMARDIFEISLRNEITGQNTRLLP
ncbi:hypothetical protein LTR08_004367 [Meristemomyces frigidus]|nr:hypothetical protein LTR08_004367 [Meristemomyces frigidus]